MKYTSYKENAPVYLREFLDYIATIKARSSNTVNSYYEDIKLFLRFLKIKNKLVESDIEFEKIIVNDLDDIYVKKVTLYDALEFLHFMADNRKNSTSARARRAVSLRQFYKYLTDNKMWFEINPIAKLQLPGAKKTLPKYLTKEQSVKILTNKYEENNYFDLRDYCILTFFLNCGMRLNELVGLNITDYREDKDLITDEEIHTLKVLGKGNKERIIYLNSACVRIYKKYSTLRNEFLDKNNKTNEKAMFLSKQLKRITDRRIQQIIGEIFKKNNLDGLGLSVHKLRHTAATLMYQNGVDIRVLKEVLGHENLDTTQIYTHVVNSQIKKAMDKNPLAGIGLEKN